MDFTNLYLAREDMNVSISSTNKKLEDLIEEVKFSIKKFNIIEDFNITNSVVNIFQYLYKCKEFLKAIKENNDLSLEDIELCKSNLSNKDHRVRIPCTFDRVKATVNYIYKFCDEVTSLDLSNDIIDVLKSIFLSLPKEIYTLIKVIAIQSQEDSKSMESLVNNSKSVDLTMKDTFSDVALALEHHYKFVSNYNFDVANESFSSVVTNMVVYIADCIIKLFNNFKTTIFKFYKTLKRTELRYYAESNALKLKQIFSVPYTDMADVEVDIPRGLVKPYKVVTNNLIEILTVLDMKNRSEGFLSKIMDLEQKVTTNSDLSMSKKLGSVEDISVIQKTYNEVTKCFSNSERALKKKFSKVFEDDNCFEDTYNLLLNSETFDYEVSTIHNNLEKCEKRILNVVDYIKKNKTELNKSDILDLSKSTMTLAKIFDMYGNCILNKQKVEHNFVYVLNAIKRACL